MPTECRNDEARRRELGAFLRKKREGLTPPRGVGAHQRRLTPGLRREEVAGLASVGTTWYTWLEQARDIRPSERALRSIARALQLSKLETRYLLDLGLEHAPRPAGDLDVAREVVLMVKAMSTPAFVVGRTGNFLAYNVSANALYDFDFVPEDNFLLALFSPNWRALVANWSEYAMHAVGVFRRRSAGVLGDTAVAEIVAELSQRSPEFDQWWGEQEVSEPKPIGYVCNHPFVGQLEFDHVCFSVVEYPDLAVIGLVTELAETKQRLAELVRQLEHGEHDATHNVWTAALAPQSISAAHDSHSQYQ